MISHRLPTHADSVALCTVNNSDVSMSKKEGQRDAFLDVIGEHLLAHGLERTRLVDLAAAAKTSDRMLIYYFGTKAELMSAAIGRVAGDLAQHLDDAIATEVPLPAADLLEELARLTASERIVPYMRLGLEIYGKAASGDPQYEQAGRDIIGRFLEWAEARIAASDTAHRKDQAAAVLAMTQGLAVMSVGFSDTSRQRAVRAMVAALNPEG